MITGVCGGPLRASDLQPIELAAGTLRAPAPRDILAVRPNVALMGVARPRLLYLGKGRGSRNHPFAGCRLCGVRVNAICPSAPMTERFNELVAGNAALTPLVGAFARPQCQCARGEDCPDDGPERRCSIRRRARCRQQHRCRARCRQQHRLRGDGLASALLGTVHRFD